MTREEIAGELGYLAHGLWQRFEGGDTGARTLTMKIKYNNFEQVTRSRTPGFSIRSYDELKKFLMRY